MGSHDRLYDPKFFCAIFVLWGGGWLLETGSFYLKVLPKVLQGSLSGVFLWLYFSILLFGAVIFAIGVLLWKNKMRPALRGLSLLTAFSLLRWLHNWRGSFPFADAPVPPDLPLILYLWREHLVIFLFLLMARIVLARAHRTVPQDIGA
jgi:hypothetical protein